MQGAAADPSTPAQMPARVRQPPRAPWVRQLLGMTQGYNRSEDVRRHKLWESDALSGLLKQSQQTEQLKFSQVLEDQVKSHTQSQELPPRGALQNTPGVALLCLAPMLSLLTFSGQSQQGASLQRSPHAASSCS